MTYFLLAAFSAALLVPFSPLAAVTLLPIIAMQVRRNWPSGVLSWLMLSWLVWMPASLFWSMSPGFSIQLLTLLLCLPMGWLLGIRLMAQYSGERLDRLLFLCLSGTLLILVTWAVLQGPNTFTGKPQGPFNDPNTFAAVLSLLLLPGLARYLASDIANQPGWQRCGILALIGATFFVDFLVASRGATLALLLVLPLLLWLARSHPRFSRKLGLLAVVAICAYVAAQGTSGLSIAQRMAGTVQEGDPARLNLMRSAWLMIQDQPWLGSGFGSFRLRYPQYRLAEESGTAGGWVHNDYLQFWLEAGLPMLLLLLGLVIWVTWAVVQTLRKNDSDALYRMGYLAAIAAILLHAPVNFLLYFAVISLLLGVYLARIDLPNLPMPLSGKILPPPRAQSLAAGGYVFIVGYLLLSQMAVEALLEKAPTIQRVLSSQGVVYPRYQMAYWLSVFAPFHPSPSQVMGLELADGYLFLGRRNQGMRDEALMHMDEAWRQARCYLPFNNDALEFVRQAQGDPALRRRGQAIAERALACNPRHGLSYYYAGVFADSQAAALDKWRAGLAASPYKSDQLLLTVAILSMASQVDKDKYAEMAGRMARDIREHELKPTMFRNDAFWTDAQNKLLPKK